MTADAGKSADVPPFQTVIMSSGEKRKSLLRLKGTVPHNAGLGYIASPDERRELQELSVEPWPLYASENKDKNGQHRLFNFFTRTVNRH
jgi:hypothetical protein